MHKVTLRGVVTQVTSSDVEGFNIGQTLIVVQSLDYVKDEDIRPTVNRPAKVTIELEEEEGLSGIDIC